MRRSAWLPYIVAVVVAGVAALVWWLSAVFAPLFIGLTLAWALQPAVDKLGRQLGSRQRAAAWLIGGGCLLGAVFAAVAVPMLVREGRHWSAAATGEGPAVAGKELDQVVSYGQWADPEAETWNAAVLATEAEKSGAPAAVGRALRMAVPAESKDVMALCDALGDRDCDGRLEPGYARRLKLLARDKRSRLGAAAAWVERQGLPQQAEKLLQKYSQREQLAKIVQGGALATAGEFGLRVLGSLRQVAAMAVAFGLGALLVPIYTFFFVIALPRWQAALPAYLPAANRETWLRALRRVGVAIAGFVRGRMVVCSIVAAMTAVGWALLGVRLGLLLGLAVGALTVIPLANVLAAAPALLICLIDVATDQHGWGWFAGVVAVYAAGQIAESILNPIIVGDAVQIDTVTIIVAFLIGGALFGLVGLLLAVPVAATLRIFADEFWLPAWRAWAAGPPPPLPEDPSA